MQIRDYERQTVTLDAGGKPQPLAGPQGDMVILDLATEGNYVACRPSGTEPKIKFYMFAYKPPEQLANLDAAKARTRRAARSHGSRPAKIRGRVTRKVGDDDAGIVEARR